MEEKFNQKTMEEISKKRTYVLIALAVIIIMLIANAYLLWNYQATGAKLTETLERCNPFELCEQVINCPPCGEYQDIDAILG